MLNSKRVQIDLFFFHNKIQINYREEQESMIIKSAKKSLPSINNSKNVRLSLDKKQISSPVQNKQLDKNNFKVVKQSNRKSMSLQFKRSSVLVTKHGQHRLGSTAKTNKSFKNESTLNGSKSEQRLQLKKQWMKQEQSFEGFNIQCKKQQKLPLLDESLNSLRPCHNKLLKNLLGKPNSQSLYLSTFSSVQNSRHKPIENQSQFNLSQENKGLNLCGILQSICKKNQRGTLFPSIEKENNESQDLVESIEQKFRTFDLNQPRKDEISAQKVQIAVGDKKSLKSVGTMTQLSINKESYKEFMKFKLTQQDSYFKMQQLFSFIDDLSSQKKFQFQQRHQNLKKMYDETFETQREQKIIQLISNIDNVKNDFSASFGTYMNQLSKVEDFVSSGSRVQLSAINNEIAKIRKIFSKIAPLLQLPNKSVVKENKQNMPNTIETLFIEVSSKFQKIAKYMANFQSKHLCEQQKISQMILKGKEQLVGKFQAWKQSTEQKGFMLKVCLNDLIRLPQISTAIFGMQNEAHTSEEVKMLKKIGIYLGDIPEFDYFYKERLESVDCVFKEMMNVKCLNCAYFKSKMRFIQKTNSQLQPVLKILNHLVTTQIKNSF